MKVTVRVTAHDLLPVLALPVCLLATVALAIGMAWLKTSPSREVAGFKPEAHRTSTAIQPATEVTPLPKLARRPLAAPGTELGRFDIPALKMSWVVLEGTEERTLDRGIGHIGGTASIGDAGNIGIAGHRNTHFRKLEWLRLGDEIVLTSKDGAFRYRVNYVHLHQPTDVDVLDAQYGPAVTLVTCFPFEYVGSAPLRLIVRAVAEPESITRLLAPPQAGPGRTAPY